MKHWESVTKIMSKDLVTLNLKDDLYKAEKLFKKYKIRHIPVVDKETIVGMLSLTDLKRISFMDVYDEEESFVNTAVYDMLSLEQVMVRTPVNVSSSVTIKEVAEILAEKEFHALPVVEDDKLRGIVTTTDLLKYLLEQY